MKKTIVGIAFMAMAMVPSLASSGENIQKEEYKHAMVLDLVKQRLEEHDKTDLTLWYLKAFKKKTYAKVYRDEFKLEKAKREATKELDIKMAEAKPLSADIKFAATMPYSSFKTYDFDKKGFPLKGVVEEGTYLYYPGDGVMLNGSRGLTINFINADESKNIIPMEEDQAHKFMKKRSNSTDGKRIYAKYTYTVIDYNEQRELNYLHGMWLEVNANILSVEYSIKDANGKTKVITTVDFSPAAKKEEPKNEKSETVSSYGFTADGYKSGMSFDAYKKQKVGAGNILSTMSIVALNDSSKGRMEDKTDFYMKKIINKDVKAMAIVTFTAEPPYRLYRSAISWGFGKYSYDYKDQMDKYFDKLKAALSKKYGESFKEIEYGVQWMLDDKVSITLKKGVGMSMKDVEVEYLDLPLKTSNKNFIAAIKKEKGSDKAINEAADAL